MGLAQRVQSWLSSPGFSLGAVGGSPADDRFWSDYSSVYQSTTGITVTPEQAFRVSAFFQGVRLIAETAARLPRRFYRELEDGSKQTDHSEPLCDALCHESVNPWQTSQQWMESMTAWAIAYPFSLSEIKIKPGGVLELWPIDPGTYEDVEQLGDGTLRYVIAKTSTTEKRKLHQDDVFKLQGLGLHEFMGANLLSLCRETIGGWVALELFENRYFSGGGQPRMVFSHPGRLGEKGYQNVRAGYERFVSGLGNAWRPMIVEEGMTPHMVGGLPKDAMMVEARAAAVREIARWLNIPPHKLMDMHDTAKANREQQGQEFVEDTMDPWLKRWAGAAKKQLVVGEDIYLEFDTSSLLKGTKKDQAEADSISVQAGIESENEVRRRRNLNPVPGLDTPQRSQNIGAEPSNQLESPDNGSARAVALATAAADRIEKRERKNLEGKARSLAADPDSWSSWLATFYEGHAAIVAEALQVAPGLARAYCRERLQAITDHGPEAPIGSALLDLALGESEHGKE